MDWIGYNLQGWERTGKIMQGQNEYIFILKQL